MLKHLHDIKVKSLIKVGIPSDSLFAKQYKFFYFNAETSEMEVQKVVMLEISNDFGEQAKDIVKKYGELNFRDKFKHVL